MKKLIFIYLLVFSSFCFSAVVTTKPTIYYTTTGSTTYSETSPPTFFSTQEAACRNYYDRVFSTANNFVSLSVGGSSNTSAGTCYLILTQRSNNAAANQSTGINIAMTCPTGSSIRYNATNYFNATCEWSSCPAGSVADSSGQCIDNCAPLKGTSGSFLLNGSVNSASSGSAICMPNNCSSNVNDSSSAQIGGKWYGTVSVIYNGSTCNGEQASSGFSNPTNATPPPADTPEAECVKQGKSFGTVNGQVVCVNSGTPGTPAINNSSVTNTTITTTSSSGNQSTTGSTEVKNVTQDGDQITSTVTKTNSDGTKSESTITQPLSEFCANNPNNSICKTQSEDDNVSEFGGDCNSSFSCTGDSIQCAIALKQHQIYCEAIQDNPVRDQFTNEVAENAGKGLSDWIPQSIINIPTDLTGQKLLASACIPDMVFPLVGQSFTLPFSKLCPALEFCGTIVKLFSYLFSAIIIFGRRGA